MVNSLRFEKSGGGKSCWNIPPPIHDGIADKSKPSSPPPPPNRSKPPRPPPPGILRARNPEWLIGIDLQLLRRIPVARHWIQSTQIAKAAQAAEIAKVAESTQRIGTIKGR